VTRPPLLNGEEARGTIRVLVVRQRHERSHRTITLLDAEGLGETKTRFRKHQFSYSLEGISDVEVKRGEWLLSPRDDLGFILDVKTIGPWGSGKSLQKRFELRVRFNDSGLIRLNESWLVFRKRPVTSRILSRWEKRMTNGAEQYYHQVLPTVIDSLLHSSESLIDGDQIEAIYTIQRMILSKAIRIAEAHEIIRLSSTQLIQATQEVLKQSKLSQE
jgi:hypothetical protein